MFVGLAFILITSVFPLLVWAGYGIARLIRGPEPEPSKRLTPMQKSKLTREKNAREAKIWGRWKLAFFIFLPLWLAVYALFLFPAIPSGFGGAKPYAARLIGDEDTIRKINDQIAFAAGIPAEKLPFEILPGTSGLTTGANVLILDKSASRIFLLLTRDLYLSSTSSFAKKMLELGKIDEEVEISDIEDFQIKPLIVSASGVDGITLDLYQPDTGTTIADLQLAAEIVASNPSRAQEVSAAISEDLPGVGEVIVAAVQGHGNANQADSESTSQNDEEFGENTDSSESLEEVINTAIEASVDTKFLNFRSAIFNEAVVLVESERRMGQSTEGRLSLVETITNGFKKDFPAAWALLDTENNFLIVGQGDLEFPRKIKEAVRGAGDAFTIMERLNTTEREEIHPFFEIQAGAKKVLDNSIQTNTQENRKFVAQVLRDYFNNQAPRYRDFWAGGYMDTGVEDEMFFTNLDQVFTEPETWEEFGVFLSEFEASMNASCEDGILNQDEGGIDCGGVCEPCAVEEEEEVSEEPEAPAETCEDGILNQDEEGVDCGGVCAPCEEDDEEAL